MSDQSREGELKQVRGRTQVPGALVSEVFTGVMIVLKQSLSPQSDKSDVDSRQFGVRHKVMTNVLISD